MPLPYQQSPLDSFRSRSRSRCLQVDCISAAAGTQRAQQGVPTLVLSTSGSETTNLVKRLALTSRYQIDPQCRGWTMWVLDRIAREQLLSYTDPVSLHMQTADLISLQSQTQHACVQVDRNVVQLIATLLDTRHSSTHREGRWIMGDQMLSAVKDAIAVLEAHQKGWPDTLSSCKDTTQNTLSASFCDQAFLQCVSKVCTLIKLLVQPSNSAVCHADACRVSRESNMLKVSPYRGLYHNPEVVVLELNEVSQLAYSGDFAPIFLGSEYCHMDRDRASGLDYDSTIELLYLQLMLKCSTFFVHCIGNEHIVGFLRLAAHLRLHLQILPTMVHATADFWEPDWDLADAEMLVEVNYTSENQQQQKLQDLRVGAGIRACANQQGSIMEMLQWFTRHKDPQSSTRDKPINITARDRDVAGIVMVLSREVAVSHVPINMFVQLVEQPEIPDAMTLMRLVSLAVHPVKPVADDMAAFRLIAL